MRETKFYNRLPVLTAFIIQLTVLVMMLPLIASFSSVSIFVWAVLHGIVAAIFSYFFKMATWWIPIQLCFMPAIIATHAIELSPYWFGLGFCLLVLIYGKTYQTQVPLYLSSKEVTAALTSFLPSKKDFTFIDLGCGCGGLLSRLNKTRTNGVFYGVEAALLPYLIGKIRNLCKESGCKVLWGDLWKQNLSQYDVVYAYLSPVPMKSIWEKACREMRPGSIFISNTFMIPGVAPEKSIRLNDFSGSTLYIWRI
ncbi:MAG TPA: class I SAM-dependent methyltransferase [Nitrosomonas sp.]|nr:class I SAM-dependent methyltransferase [Nitrosomonas sp.]